MDVSTSVLRTARVVAELGSISAAARALGYTQSAVSRQISSLEREMGHPLFARTVHGVRPTREGAILIRGAADILTRLEATATEIAGITPGRTVRVGVFPAAAAVLLPPALLALRRSNPDLEVVSRSGSTPALVRALRAGALDIAIISQQTPFRAPDNESPAILLETLFDTELRIGAAPDYFEGDCVGLAELVRSPWIAPATSNDEPQIGVWPGLPGRPRVTHRANDWLVRLRLAASGVGITSVPGPFLTTIVPGLRSWRVDGVPIESRRVSLAQSSGGASSDEAQAVAVTAFVSAAAALIDAAPS